MCKGHATWFPPSILPNHPSARGSIRLHSALPLLIIGTFLNIIQNMYRLVMLCSCFSFFFSDGCQPASPADTIQFRYAAAVICLFSHYVTSSFYHFFFFIVYKERAPYKAPPGVPPAQCKPIKRKMKNPDYVPEGAHTKCSKRKKEKEEFLRLRKIVRTRRKIQYGKKFAFSPTHTRRRRRVAFSGGTQVKLVIQSANFQAN